MARLILIALMCLPLAGFSSCDREPRTLVVEVPQTLLTCKERPPYGVFKDAKAFSVHYAKVQDAGEDCRSKVRAINQYQQKILQSVPD